MGRDGVTSSRHGGASFWPDPSCYPDGVLIIIINNIIVFCRAFPSNTIPPLLGSWAIDREGAIA